VIIKEERIKELSMNVLSLFDGLGGARIVLDRIGMKPCNYFASEIDKHAMKIANVNYPDIIQLGDIRNVSAKSLPAIDLLIGGSPCQDLSNAQKGKGLKGEKSMLFHEYIRIIDAVKPKFFLLENVVNKWAPLMSDIVGVTHVKIDSAVYSAQSRPRFYWTNIPIKNTSNIISSICLKDILEKKADHSVFSLDDRLVSKILKKVSYEERKTMKSNSGILKLFDIPKNLLNDNERQRRVYSVYGKTPTLLARVDTTKICVDGTIRKLTPLECERAQTLPDNYTALASNSQRYKMIGNGFTIDVIAHILGGLTRVGLNSHTRYDRKKIISNKKAKQKNAQLELSFV